MSSLKEQAEWIDFCINRGLPTQNIRLCPITHYDGMNDDSTGDYILTFIIGNQQSAVRINLRTMLRCDEYVNRLIQTALKDGNEVCIYTGKPKL